MTDEPLGCDSLVRQILDAIPAFVLVVDEDVSILEFNLAAGKLMGAERAQILRRRSGDMLHCIHSRETAGGCGRAPFCKSCPIRGAVKEAIAGSRCVRRRLRMQLQSSDQISELYVLLSASPFVFEGKTRVLLALEEVGDLLRLQSLLPICINCKRVRDEHRHWNEVDAYLRKHLDLLMKNSYCPECLARQEELDQLKLRVARLTPREHEVFCLVVLGRLNKQIAHILGTTEKTIKVHRGRVMRKMQVQSMAELVHLADKLGLPANFHPDPTATVSVSKAAA